MKVLRRTQFGNPVLRGQARQLTKKEIASKEIQQLISDMHHTLGQMDMGVGLAAPQVGQSVALAVIRIRPRQYRKDVKNFDLVMVNPKITQSFGRKTQKWEGCISSGLGKAGLFAKVPRYKKIELSYMDEKGIAITKEFSGLIAHVIQHEVDHLNGILFVDRVKNTKTYMTFSEYKKRASKTLTKSSTTQSTT